MKSKLSIITVRNYDLLLDGNPKENSNSADTSNANQPDNEQNISHSSLLNNNSRKEEAGETQAATAACNELVTSVIDKYNEICKSLPKIQANVAVQYRAELIRKAQDIMGEATFEQLFQLVEQSDFLTRRGADSGFRADFEWIMKPDNLAKILSGAYSENYSKAEKKNVPAVPSAGDYEVSLYE